MRKLISRPMEPFHLGHLPILLIFGLSAWALPGAAQLPVSGPAPSSLFGYRPRVASTSALAAEPDDSLRQPRRTYWKEGGLIGGALGLVGGAVVAQRLCGVSDDSTDDCTSGTLVAGAIGAALLALPGALIGHQFRKKPAADPAPGSETGEP